jgi:hypothetical protein
MTARITRVERARMPLARDVVLAAAVEHGVCIRPLPVRRIDTVTAEATVIPVPCGATLAAKCPSCAERARRLRMAQCREGWHLDTEPLPDADDPDAEQRALVELRANLTAALHTATTNGDTARTAQLEEAVTDTDELLAAAGVRGSVAPGRSQGRRSRSTRRRQDAPDLPRRPVEARTLGRTFTGKDGTVWRPSTFLTLTCDSYGRVTSEGVPVDPANYDYRRAARDAIHFPALVDRFWQNLRRCVGYDVQYFAAVEPQRRLAPHLHAAVRGTIPGCWSARSPPRRTTRCGGRPMTNRLITRAATRSGTPRSAVTSTRRPARCCRPGISPWTPSETTTHRRTWSGSARRSRWMAWSGTRPTPGGASAT